MHYKHSYKILYLIKLNQSWYGMLLMCNDTLCDYLIEKLDFLDNVKQI